MRRHTPEDAHVVVTDVTSGIGQLNVQGPLSRDVLQATALHSKMDTQWQSPL